MEGRLRLSVHSGTDRLQAEQLGTSDRGVILLRKLLMEAIETVQQGGVPLGIIPKEKEHEMITLDDFRRILPQSEVAELLHPV